MNPLESKEDSVSPELAEKIFYEDCAKNKHMVKAIAQDYGITYILDQVDKMDGVTIKPAK